MNKSYANASIQVVEKYTGSAITEFEYYVDGKQQEKTLPAQKVENTTDQYSATLALPAEDAITANTTHIYKFVAVTATGKKSAESNEISIQRLVTVAAPTMAVSGTLDKNNSSNEWYQSVSEIGATITDLKEILKVQYAIPTNETVVLEDGSVIEEEAPLDWKDATWNGSTWKIPETQYAEGEQTYYMRTVTVVSDNYYGDEIASDNTSRIVKLDKNGPQKISLEREPENWTNQDVKLTVTAEDTLSGLFVNDSNEDKAYSFYEVAENQKPGQELNGSESEWSQWQGAEYTVMKPTESSVVTKLVYVKVRDLAGNVSVLNTPVIVKFDTQAPTVGNNITVKPSTWTNQNVVVKATATDDNAIEYRFYVADADANAPTGSEAEAAENDVSGMNNWTSWSNKDTYTVTASDYPNVEQQYKVYVQAKDELGNTSEVKAAENLVKFDTLAPRLTLQSSLADNEWTNGSVTITAKAEDRGADSDERNELKYRFLVSENEIPDVSAEGISWSEWNTGNTISVENNCYIYVQAQDDLGNINQNSIQVVHIDKDVPIIGIELVNSNSESNVYREAPGLKVTITDPENGSGIAENGINFIVKKNGEVVENATWIKDNENSTVNSYVYTCNSLIEDGDYEITVNAKDVAGNNANSAKVSYAVDATAPTITIKADKKDLVDNEYWTNAESTDVTITVTDAHLSDTNLRVTVDDVDPVEGVGEINWTTEGITKKGTFKISNAGNVETTHIITVTAADTAGNESGEVTGTIHVDRVAPTVDIQKGETSIKDSDTKYYQPDANGKISLTLTAADSSLDVKNISVTGVENINWTEIPATEDTAAYKQSTVELAEGDHNITVTATDKAGNQTTAKSTVVVDGTPPVIVMDNNSNPNGKTFTTIPSQIAITVTDNLAFDKVTAIDKITAGNGDSEKELTFSHNTKEEANVYKSIGTHSWEDGIHTVTITAVDKAGNTSTQEVNFTVDTKAPTITEGTEENPNPSTKVEAIENDTTQKKVTVSVAATDNLTGELQYRFIKQENKPIADDWSNNKTGDVQTWTKNKDYTFTVDTPKTDTTYTVWYQVKDAAGNVTEVQSVNVTVKADENEPTVSNPTNQTPSTSGNNSDSGTTNGTTDSTETIPSTPSEPTEDTNNTESYAEPQNDSDTGIAVYSEDAQELPAEDTTESPDYTDNADYTDNTDYAEGTSDTEVSESDDNSAEDVEFDAEGAVEENQTKPELDTSQFGEADKVQEEETPEETPELTDEYLAQRFADLESGAITLEDLSDEELIALIEKEYLGATAMDGRLTEVLDVEDDPVMTLMATNLFTIRDENAISTEELSEGTQEVTDEMLAESIQNAEAGIESEAETPQDQAVEEYYDAWVRATAVNQYGDSEEVQEALEQNGIVQLYAENLNEDDSEDTTAGMTTKIENTFERDPLLPVTKNQNKYPTDGNASYAMVNAYNPIVNVADFDFNSQITVQKADSKYTMRVAGADQLVLYSMMLDAGFLNGNHATSLLMKKYLTLTDGDGQKVAESSNDYTKLNSNATTIALAENDTYDMTTGRASNIRAAGTAENATYTAAPDVKLNLLFRGLGKANIYANNSYKTYRSTSANGRQFAANFDGNGSTVKLAKDITAYTNRQNGFFNYIEGSSKGTVRNLTVTGSVKGNSYVGGLVGFLSKNEYRFENITIQDMEISSGESSAYHGHENVNLRKSDQSAGGLIGGVGGYDVGGTKLRTATTTTEDDQTEHFKLAGKEANIENVHIKRNQSATSENDVEGTQATKMTITAKQAGGLIGRSNASAMWINRSDVTGATITATTAANENYTGNTGGAIGYLELGDDNWLANVSHYTGQSDDWRIQNSSFSQNTISSSDGSTGGILGRFEDRVTSQSSGIHLIELQAAGNTITNTNADKTGTVLGCSETTKSGQKDYGIYGVNVWSEDKAFTQADNKAVHANKSTLVVNGSELATDENSGEYQEHGVMANAEFNLQYYTFFEDRLNLKKAAKSDAKEYEKYFTQDMLSTSYKVTNGTEFEDYTGSVPDGKTFAYMKWDSDQSLVTDISTFMTKINEALFAKDYDLKLIQSTDGQTAETYESTVRTNYTKNRVYTRYKLSARQQYNGSITPSHASNTRNNVTWSNYAGWKVTGSDKENEYNPISVTYTLGLGTEHSLSWKDSYKVNIDASVQIATKAWSAKGDVSEDIMSLASQNQYTKYSENVSVTDDPVSEYGITADNKYRTVTYQKDGAQYTKTTTSVPVITEQNKVFQQIKDKMKTYEGRTKAGRTKAEWPSTVSLMQDAVFTTYAEFAYSGMRYDLSTIQLVKNETSQKYETVITPISANKQYALTTQNTTTGTSLPAGTIIKMIDLTNGVNKTYTYTVPAGNQGVINLGQFKTIDGVSFTDSTKDRDASRNYYQTELEEYNKALDEWNLSTDPDKEASKPQLKDITSAENVLQPENYTYLMKRGAGTVAQETNNVGVERFLFVVDMTNTDANAKLEAATYDSWVLRGSSTGNAVNMNYSVGNEPKPYAIKYVDDITLEQKRQLDIENASDNKTGEENQKYFYSRETELKINFNLYDWYAGTEYYFNKDEANNTAPYLDIIGKIVKVDASGNETTVPLSGGTRVKYLNNQQEMDEPGQKQYQQLQSSDGIFFFRDQKDANGKQMEYNMKKIIPAASREEGKMPKGIILNFANASNFKIEANCDYYFVLDLKRSPRAEFSDSINSIQTIRIPLTVLGSGSEYGYRMNISNTNQLSVNLNNIAQGATINVENEFSGTNLADNSDVQLEYKLYYKKSDNTYTSWKDNNTDKTPIFLSGTTDAGTLSNKDLIDTVTFAPWYLTAPKAEEKPGYTITKDDSGTKVTAKAAQGNVVSSALLNENGMLEISATLNGKEYTSSMTVDSQTDKPGAQLVSYLKHIQKTKVATGYTGVMGDNEKDARTQFIEILRILKEGSVQQARENDKPLVDANDQNVYTYQTDLCFNTGKTDNYTLPLGNYKLVGKLKIDGTEVASDYIIFNVNKLNVYDVIQDSNRWYKNDNSNTDSGSN